MKQRTVSAHCRLSEFWMVATLSVSSRRCTGRGTAVCCAGPLLSLLRPIARLWMAQSEIEGHGAECSWGPGGAPKKQPGTAIRGGRDTGPLSLPDRNCGPWSSTLAGAPGVPRRSGLGPLLGVMITWASPAISASELTKNWSSGM